MSAHIRPRGASLATKTLSSAIACAVLLSPAAYAAELGKITVLSAVGEPLRAEVELSAVKPGESASLLAKLAPADAYRQAVVDLNPALNGLAFSIETRTGKPYIRISSAQPLSEPLVNLLVELSSKNGRQVREYAFVLDTPEARRTRGAQVAAPVTPKGAKDAVQADAAKPAEAEKPAAAGKAEGSKAGKSDYRVRQGDTLSRIASELKPSGVSLDMMLVALYRANPDAFSGENMNRMQAGRILSVPSAEAVRATDAAEARRVVTAHAVDFESYRNRLAGQVAQSKPARAAEAAQSSTGKIGATRVQEKPNAVSEAQDKLKLSKAEPVAKPGSTTVAGDEEKIAKAKQVEEAAARVKELEKNVSDLEKLMAVKNKAMADQSAPSPAKPEDSAASAPAAPATQPAQPPVPKAKPVPLVKKPSPLEPTLADKISDHMGAIGIGLAALLAAVAALVIARRKKETPRMPPQEDVAPTLDPETPPPAPAEPGADAAPEPAGDRSFAAAAAAAGIGAVAGAAVVGSTPPGAAAPLGGTALGGNEVDPVAEADVYIAYGRDGQAEEILKEALRAHPEHHAARLKLLEIYSARQDAAAFEEQASELYGLTRGSGEEWPQAAAMGAALDPSNPLYGDADIDAVVSLSKPLDDGLHGQSVDLPLAGNVVAEAAPAFTPPVNSAASAREARERLDFDLDSLDFEPVSTNEPIVMPGPVATPDAAAAEDKFDASMDFGLDLEPPGAPVNGQGPGLTPLPDPLKEVDLAHFDLDTPATPVPPEAPPAATASADTPADALFDETPPAAPPASPAPAAPEFDLTGIDLDLDENKAAQAGVDDPLSAIHMEMDTKLDLAIAYQEIGDKEGARELIDEVIKGGSPEQVAKANTMRALLA